MAWDLVLDNTLLSQLGKIFKQRLDFDFYHIPLLPKLIKFFFKPGYLTASTAQLFFSSFFFRSSGLQELDGAKDAILQFFKFFDIRRHVISSIARRDCAPMPTRYDDRTLPLHCP